MAAVTITADNDRIDDADTITGWTGIGGGQGPSAENSFPYQGVNLVNRKVTGTGGMTYDPVSDGGAARNFTTAGRRHLMAKAIVTDYGGLNAVNGLRVRIGSSSTAFYDFEIAGSSAVKPSLSQYPPKGGFIIVPISPNIAALRTTTSGSPNLTAVDYLGLEANFDSSTAKSENVGLDALDCGSGLNLTGGDGADPDGIWQDFVDADEGTNNNRWGYASIATGPILQFFGQMTVGGAAATVFTDNEAQVLWPDGLFEPGFSKAFMDLQNAASVLTDGSAHTSLGTAVGSDTRADYEWSGTAGTGLAQHTLNNFRNYLMTSAVVADGADIEIASLTLNGGTIQNSTIRVNSTAGNAIISDPNTSLLSNVRWVQTGVGHAIEITSPGTVTLSQQFFEGFGDNQSTSAAVYNNSGGAVTIVVVGGGDSPTFRDGAGASTTISNPKNIAFDLNWAGGTAPADYEYRLYVDDPADGVIGTVELAGAENEPGTTTTISYPYTYAGDTNVVLQILATGFRERLFKAVLRATDQTLDVDIALETNT